MIKFRQLMMQCRGCIRNRTDSEISCRIFAQDQQQVPEEKAKIAQISLAGSAIVSALEQQNIAQVYWQKTHNNKYPEISEKNEQIIIMHYNSEYLEEYQIMKDAKSYYLKK